MARKKQPRKENKAALTDKLIILGILLFLLGTITHRQIYFNALISQREHPKDQYLAQAPVSISIPSVKIDMNVDEGGITDGNWVLSDKNALYLPTSGKIGEGYNTIIYAHNTDKLFGSLKKINLGDIIILKDRQGKKFSYRIVYKNQVDPDDLRKLYSPEKNIVTLFTCDGWFDEERFLVKGRLVEEKNLLFKP